MFAKRLFDIAVSLILLLPTVLLMLILIPAIRLDSPGPALFRQKRVGKNQKTFTLSKFRTMKVDTGNLPSHEVGKNTMTRLGPFLRKSKLDELPQILSVLKGDMSFVGPRPCLPSQDILIEHRKERGVFSVLPGITGLAQIQGVDMSEPEKLAVIDGEYVRQYSLAMDVKLCWLTAIGKGSGDAAG